MSPADPPEKPPLTRRRLRQMRTQGIPIILPGTTPLVAAAAPAADPEMPVDPETPVEAIVEEAQPEPTETESVTEDIVDAVVVDDESVEDAAADESDAADGDAAAEPSGDDADSGRVIAADFGAELLAGDATTATPPPSFDHLLTRSGPTGGSTASPNALILSQTPETGPLVVPVQASGEVIITGSYELPESYGSTGTVPGTADTKETDAALIDEELPLASSPIPVSASAAVSTIKSGEEIVTPPAPEKTNKVMMVLAITAGVLALGLTGVLILSFVTGVFR